MNDGHGAKQGIAAMLAGLATLPWGNIAFAVAIFYNLHLLAGWWWDRFWRDVFIRRGWYIPPPRKDRRLIAREDDREEE